MDERQAAAVANNLFGAKPFTGASETAVRMMLRTPYFMELYYSMNIYEMPTDLPPPYNTLATNGVSVWVNPNFWNQLDRDQRMTAVAHELGHKMYLHVLRRGARDPADWNEAGDQVINLGLVESGFKPLNNLTIDGRPWHWYCDNKYLGMSTEQIYDAIQKEREEGKRPARNPGAEQDLVEFGETPDGQQDPNSTETISAFEQRVRNEVKKAAEMAKMQGNTPGWMQRVVANVDHAKRMWYEVFEEYLRGLYKADYSWHRFDRKAYVRFGGVIAPDMYQPAMGGVIFFVDCSGSVDQTMINKFNKHFKDIVQELRPAWIDARYFHTSVMHDLDQHFERGDFDAELKPGGSGGTSFAWLQQEVDRCSEQPEVAIVLTDMYGDFPTQHPDIPTFWLSVSSVETAPFGTVININ